MSAVLADCVTYSKGDRYMKKRMAGVFFAILTLAAASGLTFAGAGSSQAAQGGSYQADPYSRSGQTEAASEDVREYYSPGFSARLEFDAAMDDHVTLQLTNYGNKSLQIAPAAHYMDELGTAGSLDCRADGYCYAEPGQTVSVSFYMDRAAAHGDNSILAFFFQYDDYWYLGKVGEKNGTETFRQHD